MKRVISGAIAVAALALLAGAAYRAGLVQLNRPDAAESRSAASTSRTTRARSTGARWRRPASGSPSSRRRRAATSAIRVSRPTGRPPPRGHRPRRLPLLHVLQPWTRAGRALPAHRAADAGGAASRRGRRVRRQLQDVAEPRRRCGPSCGRSCRASNRRGAPRRSSTSRPIPSSESPRAGSRGQPVWIRSVFARAGRGRLGGWLIWQYSETGRIPGIRGPVDLDVLRPGASIESLALPAAQ